MSIRQLVRAGLATVAVFAFLPGLPAQAGGYCQEGDATEGTGTTVEMTKDCFSPTVLRAETGAEVTWVNKDPEGHTVTGAAGAWGSGHKEALPGRAMAFKFDEPGVYSYTCLIHPGMTGTVVVGNGTGLGAAAEEINVEQVSLARPAAKAPQPAESSENSTGAWAGIAIAAAALGGGAGYGLGRRRREITSAAASS